MDGYKNWDVSKCETSCTCNQVLLVVQVHIFENSFTDQFNKEEIVFLAAESPNVLTGRILAVVHECLK